MYTPYILNINCQEKKIVNVLQRGEGRSEVPKSTRYTTVNLTTRGYPLYKERSENVLKKKKNQKSKVFKLIVQNHTYRNLNRTNPKRVEGFKYSNMENCLNSSKPGNKEVS